MFDTEEKAKLTTIIFATMFIIGSIFNANGYNKPKNDVIYILIWTSLDWEPFDIVPMEQKAFENCTYRNCFLTDNYHYLENIMDYDVIMFNIVEVTHANLDNESRFSLPANRSALQKYCLYAYEPPGLQPISSSWNGFFNMTFTFKFTSNVSLPFIVIRDQNDRVIGPKTDMHWMKLSEMNETSDYVKNKLKNKQFAAAWIVSHCDTPWRFSYASHLQKELGRYGHRLDIYGLCGAPCTRERMDDCFALIESDYYFYLAFENSFHPDYITEKIATALEHFAVPVVFGGGIYNRFMPEGIYLDANVVSPHELAAKINEIINDRNRYYEFFRWHDHYSFHFTREDNYSREICGLCAYLNNNKNNTGIMYNIASWWNVEWPRWPEPIEEPSQVEEAFKNVLNFLEPSSDD